MEVERGGQAGIKSPARLFAPRKVRVLEQWLGSYSLADAIETATKRRNVNFTSASINQDLWLVKRIKAHPTGHRCLGNLEVI
jgi:hypothetical protein